jgi:hypothetical protein
VKETKMPNTDWNTQRNMNEQRAAIDAALQTLEPESPPHGGLPSTANVGAIQSAQQAAEAVNQLAGTKKVRK